MSNCNWCNGTYRIRCPRCNGQRYITDTAIYSYRDDERNVPCSMCGLRGWIPCHCLRLGACPNPHCRSKRYPNCPCGEQAYLTLKTRDTFLIGDGDQ